jgi:hypothetical protein
MKIEYGAKQKPITATTEDTTNWELTLTAEGSYEEIEWFKKQLSKIGKKEN